MGPDLTSAPRTTGCPSCGAAVRPDAQWCGQCYADFRPPPPPEPAAPPPTVPAPTAAYGPPAPDPLTQPLIDLVLPVPTPAPEAPTDPAAPARPAGAAAPTSAPTAAPTWPCTRCSAANPLSATSCQTCGSGFLAAIKDEEGPLLQLPVVGDLGAMSRGKRLGLAFALVMALLVPLALITLVMTGAPPKDTAPGTSTETPISSTP